MNEVNLKLLKLIQENPDAEIMVRVSEYDVDFGESSVILMPCVVVELEEYALFNDMLLDYYDLTEKVSEMLNDKEEYDNLTENVFNEVVKKYIKENYTFEKYIVIYT